MLVPMDVRVFVVEDVRQMRAALAELFESVPGFRTVAAATTEAEANLWLDEHPGGWDLAVVDLVLQQGSGMGVVARCNAQPVRGKVVVFSAYASPAVYDRCLELGADAVIQKSDTAALLAFCRAMSDRENSGP
jgi:DNA-binding NarL/FixJ family response regulator